MRHERVKGGEVEAQLARALVASARAAGIIASIGEHRSRPWASATFLGARHEMVVAVADGGALGGWIATLPDTELALRGHLVASLAVDAIEDDGATAAISLSVLTLEDG